MLIFAHFGTFWGFGGHRPSGPNIGILGLGGTSSGSGCQIKFLHKIQNRILGYRSFAVLEGAREHDNFFIMLKKIMKKCQSFRASERSAKSRQIIKNHEKVSKIPKKPPKWGQFRAFLALIIDIYRWFGGGFSEVEFQSFRVIKKS